MCSVDRHFFCHANKALAHAWSSFDENDSIERRVCDYIAGMTDPYAERIYHRLFTPGARSSRDEL
jgi:dGTPase